MKLRTAGVTLLGALVVQLGVLASPSLAAYGNCAGADDIPATSSAYRMERAVHCLLNRTRARHGLAKLQFNRTLHRRARSRTAAMVRNHYFSHAGLDSAVSSYLAGASAWAYGENIGYGSGPYSTPRSVFRAWMHSPGHRANILTRAYRDLGVGVTFGSPFGDADKQHSATMSTIFGYRR